MTSGLGTETNLFPAQRDEGRDDLGPISDWLYGWTLPLVWFALAVVLLARIVWF